MSTSNRFQCFNHLSDDQWLSVLEESISRNTINGVKFGDFPAENIQAQFVGSANEAALREGKAFYTFTKKESSKLDMPINENSRLLDFGCGWGRYLRFFAREFGDGRMVGVDIDPDMIELNRQLGTPGQVAQISPDGQLPFDDNYFTHVIAYSVFTHLPEDVMLHWLAELRRVAANKAVFVCTVEPPRFLQFVESIDPSTQSGWHQGLRAAAGDIHQLIRRASADEFVYLPTGGGDHRDKSVYGDAVITEGYMRRVWAHFFNVNAYLDDPRQFWQAVAVLQKLSSR